MGRFAARSDRTPWPPSVGSSPWLGGTDVSAHKRAPKVASRPSIVVILTDDQPSQTLWAMPRTQRRSPHHGVKFTAFYDSVALCCPARSALLTGRYAHSTHVYGNAPPEGGAVTFRHRHDDLQTLAVWLHQAGYRTALFGKYLNGYRGGYVPPGWDTFTTSARYWGGPGYVQGVSKNYPFTTYMPNFMGTRTAQFIRSVPRGEVRSSRTTPRYAPHGRPSAEPRYASLHVCWHCHGWPTPDFNERGVNDKPVFDQRPPLSAPPDHGRAPVPHRTGTDAEVGRREGREDRRRTPRHRPPPQHDHRLHVRQRSHVGVAPLVADREAKPLPEGQPHAADHPGRRPWRRATDRAAARRERRHRPHARRSGRGADARAPSKERASPPSSATRRTPGRARSCSRTSHVTRCPGGFPATAAFAPTASCSSTTGRASRSSTTSGATRSSSTTSPESRAPPETQSAACGRPPAASCRPRPPGFTF